jgi:predicted transcriptional regulator
MTRARTFQKAPSNQHLHKALKFLEATPQQLADAIGVTPTGIGKWLKDGGVPPKWTMLACEALVRRHRKGEQACAPSKRIVRVLVLDEEKDDAIELMLEAMDITTEAWEI